MKEVGTRHGSESPCSGKPTSAMEAKLDHGKPAMMVWRAVGLRHLALRLVELLSVTVSSDISPLRLQKVVIGITSKSLYCYPSRPTLPNMDILGISPS